MQKKKQRKRENDHFRRRAVCSAVEDWRPTWRPFGRSRRRHPPIPRCRLPKKNNNKKTHKKHTKQRHFLRSSIRESKKKKNGSPSSDPSDANGAINQRHCKSEIIIHPLISLWFFFVGATRSRFHRQRNLYCIFYFWRYSSPHGWPGRKLGRRPSRRKPKRKIKEK